MIKEVLSERGEAKKTYETSKLDDSEVHERTLLLVGVVGFVHWAGMGGKERRMSLKGWTDVFWRAALCF